MKAGSVFGNTEISFAHRSNLDLRKAFLLFKIMGNPSLVSLGSRLAKWGLKNKLPLVDGIIKNTVFNQFCGGVCREDCLGLVGELKELGVHSILDYSVEGQESENQYDKKVQEILKSIELIGKTKAEPFTVFKPTAIGAYEVYEKVFTEQSNEAIVESFNRIKVRYQLLFQKAYELGVPLLIDAEESWMQDAADFLALEMMRQYNRESVLVYNTFQMYRHDRLPLLQKWLNQAKEEGFKIGAKLVRGAYMEKERERAKELGYPSPICANKEATDNNFNSAIDLVLDYLDFAALVVGSHNEESTLKTMNRMQADSISNADSRIWFAQLFGMSDHITYNLAHDGYNGIKLIPYGPIEEVLPYLIRRAEENTSVAGQTGRELSLISKEIQRRKSLR